MSTHDETQVAEVVGDDEDHHGSETQDGTPVVGAPASPPGASANGGTSVPAPRVAATRRTRGKPAKASAKAKAPNTRAASKARADTAAARAAKYPRHSVQRAV